MVLIGRDRPVDDAPLTAFLVDMTGKVSAKVGPTTAFERPPEDGTARAALLVAFDRKLGGHGAEATYTVTPYTLATLAPAGKPRAYKTDVAGELKAPLARLIGFYDGYTPILGEKPGAYDKAADVRQPPKKVVVDALTGKTASETEIADPVGWADHRPAAPRPSGTISVRRPQSRRLGCRCDRCDGEKGSRLAGGPVPSLRSQDASLRRKGRRRTS